MNLSKLFLLPILGLSVAINVCAQTNDIQTTVNIPADPDYEDTEFGELIYSEASLSTRLEILRLLSKDTPSLRVFLHAVSMGLGIEDVLDAAVRYESNNGRDYALSAIAILPLISERTDSQYSNYDLDDLDSNDDLDRYDETKTYFGKQVANRFFEDRAVLAPYPDWTEGQYHFAASAGELKELSDLGGDVKWYRNKSTKSTSERPVFISLYETEQDEDNQDETSQDETSQDQTSKDEKIEVILVDNAQRIQQAIERDGVDAQVPVVFTYNRLNERSVDQLGYPLTLRGVKAAYGENNLMLTATPEWARGDYHIFADMEEIYDVFDIPEEEDFEEEHWQSLVAEAEKYTVNDTSFIVVVLPVDAAEDDDDQQAKFRSSRQGQLLAAYDNPRAEKSYPYTTSDEEPIDLKALMAQGMLINRPDLIAALNTLGVTEVPISFFYVDAARIKAYLRGPRRLIAVAVGAGTPPGNFGGTGGFGPPPVIPPVIPPVCASPPCNN